MGILIFIGVFVASFLLGSGTGYYVQNGSGTGGGGQVIPGITSPTPTTDPLTVCLPEQNLLPPQKTQPVQLLGTSVNLEITSDYNFNVLPGDRDYGSGEYWNPNLLNKDNYSKILKYIFGGGEINGVKPDPGIYPNVVETDRRTKTYTLIKRAAWLPAWKVHDRSGNATWMIPRCVWESPSSCDVNSATTDQIYFHEMSYMGWIDTTGLDSYLAGRYQKAGPDDARGDIWVATGWCGSNNDNHVGLNQGSRGNPFDEQNFCADPLLRDFIFVVTKKGAGSRFGRSWSTPRFTQEDTDNSPDPQIREASWWTFDVYYNFASLPPSYGNLPCWTVRQCYSPPSSDPNNPGDVFDPNKRVSDPTCLTGMGNDKIISSKPKNKADLLANSVNKIVSGLQKNLSNLTAGLSRINKVQAANFPPFISGHGITYSIGPSDPIRQTIESNTYIIMSINTPPVGTVPVGTYTDRDEALIYNVTINPTNYNFIYVSMGSQIYKYGVVHSEISRKETLKLDTFTPPEEETQPPASFTYQWYTPACKPAIYLYPEKETTLSVYLNPSGYLTETDPVYKNGWIGVVAKPNGELIYENKKYPYLYYEANISDVKVPEKGWVVQKEVLPKFFDGILDLLGLNQQESIDFKEYWIKKLSDQPYYFISLLPVDYLNKIEDVQMSVKPDTFIRVRFYFEGLTRSEEALAPLLPDKPSRKGFTAVDWGGMIANGNCQEGIPAGLLSR